MTQENKNETLPKVEALADIATDEDKLFHDGYIQGAAEYLKTCATPITIAIQGEWGTGKTSFISLIEQSLQEKTEPTDGNKPAEGGEADASKYCKEIINVASIDVWKQSLANPNASPLEDIVDEIISKLKGSNLATMEEVSEFASAASKIFAAVAEGDEPEKVGPFRAVLNFLFGPKEDSKSKSEDSLEEGADVESVRNTLTEALQQCAEKYGKSEDARFVVFVDGLDHINPDAAIDLMGQINTYLSCPRCVFVLSVDETTVYDGIRKKLGDKVDEKRKKMFFDKLVQVPFRIPASAYNLEKYVKDLLKGEKELSGEYVEVINTLLDDPTLRSIKRYINTMYLYQSVLGGAGKSGDDSLAMLLAAVILEIESTQGFDAVARCAHGDEERFAEKLEAALSSIDENDGGNWAMLPSLWQGSEDAEEDTAKRSAFLSWVRKLK